MVQAFLDGRFDLPDSPATRQLMDDLTYSNVRAVRSQTGDLLDDRHAEKDAACFIKDKVSR